MAFFNSKESLFRLLVGPEPRTAWRLFGKHIIHTLFPGKNINPVPYLSPAECPCWPGVVALASEWTLREQITCRSGVFAGNIWDFCPRKLQHWNVPICFESSGTNLTKEARCTITSKDKSKCVIFEATGQEILTFSTKNHQDDRNVYVDLDNYTDTGFCENMFYLVTCTYNFHNVKVTSIVNDQSKSMEFTCKTPIGFCCVKVPVNLKTNMADLSRVKEKKKESLRIKNRYNWHALINHLMPNQRRFLVGDVTDQFVPGGDHWIASLANRLP